MSYHKNFDVLEESESRNLGALFHTKSVGGGMQ